MRANEPEAVFGIHFDSHVKDSPVHSEGPAIELEANVILGVSFDDWELAEQANVALFVRPSTHSRCE